MNTFLQKHASDVIGVLSGFDRLVLRGTLRALAYVDGMRAYLNRKHVLFKDFGNYAKRVSDRIKAASLTVAESAERPSVYLESSETRKEDVAREIAARDQIEQGLVCVLRCVEPCRSFDIFRNRETKHLELVLRQRKCLHYYHYTIHPQFGFMYTRLQSWFPFNVQIGINGREWLSHQMDSTGLRYIRRDNTFTWLESSMRAQRLFDQQLSLHWPDHLDTLMRTVHPLHDELFGSKGIDYYWTAYQSEWATDVMFRDEATLMRLYPKLLHHGLTTFASPDVLRFLGRGLPQHGGVHGNYQGEVTSDIKHRPEGMRIKHRAGRNSLKAYNKWNNLRVEVTINDPTDFKVYRTRQGDDDGHPEWLPMRKGVADLHRRTMVSQAANERYLEALAAVDNTIPLAQLVDGICKPITWKGKRTRALRPWSPGDVSLLEAIGRGKFLLNGLRNRDIRAHLYPRAYSSADERRRQSAAVTRRLRLLRAHRLIAKVPKTHRYTVTESGRSIIAALIAARRSNTTALLQAATDVSLSSITKSVERAKAA